MLHISQEQLITRLSERTHYTPETIKAILKNCSVVLQDILTVDPTEDMVVDIWEGLKVKRVFEDEKIFSRGKFQNLECGKKIKIKAYITKPYKDKINKATFGEKNKE